MTQQFYINSTTKRFIGSFDGDAPLNSEEVPFPPEVPDAQTWDGAGWVDDPDRSQREQTGIDSNAVLSAGKDVVLLLIELIDWQLANSTMTATDFSTNVRQGYQDLKPIADRLKA